MDILYDKRLEHGDAEYSLKDVDNFEQTDDLSKALETFFLDKSKGIHVATICADKENVPTNDLQDLFHTSMDSGEELCEIDPSKFVASGWKHGNYFYIDCAGSIVDSLKIIIKCAKGLGIDTIKAENGLNTYCDSEHNPYTSNIWSQANAWQFSQIVETNQGCANIRILLILPETCFDIFQISGHYFPSQFEHIVRGISTQREIEIVKKELAETKAELTETKAELAETKVELATVKKERDNYNKLFMGPRVLGDIKKLSTIEILSLFLLKQIERNNYPALDLSRPLINQWLQEYFKGESLKKDISESDYNKPHELEDAIQGRDQAIEPHRRTSEQHKDSTKDRDELPNKRPDDDRDER